MASSLLPRPSEDSQSGDDHAAATASPRTLFQHRRSLDLSAVNESLFEPNSWITCCGVLEKKRDGAWREGWAKRFFVLGKHILYYYLIPKPDKTTGGFIPLLGEERGQIKISDLSECKITGQDKEFVYLQLNLKNLRKPTGSGKFSSAVFQIQLRAPVETGNMWFEALVLATKASGNLFSPTNPTSSLHTFSKSFRQSMIEEPVPPTGKTRRKKRTSQSNLGVRVINNTLLSKTPVEEAFPFARKVYFFPYLALCALFPALLWHDPIWFPLAIVVDVLVLGFCVEAKKREMFHDSLVREARLRMTVLTKEMEAREVELQALLTTAAEQEDTNDDNEDEEEREEEEEILVADIIPGHFAGVSMQQSSIPTMKPGFDFMTWHNSEAQNFKLRIGPNYKKNGAKAPSLESMYTCIGIDLLRSCSGERMGNIMNSTKIRKGNLCNFDDVEQYQRAGVPKYFVVNTQVPDNSPAMWGDDKSDVGYNLIIYFQCRPSLLNSILSFDPPVPPAVRLLQDYVKSHSTQPDIRRRFKAMGMVEGLKDVGIPGIQPLIEKFQGKPAIINKVAQIFESETKMEWFEVDISIFDFPYLAKRALFALKDRVSEIQCRCGFTLQGETDDELPECLLGAVDICGLDFRLAQVV